MATKLKITKKDGSIHYVPANEKTKAFWGGLNKLYGADKSVLIEEVDEKDIDRAQWKDKSVANFTLATAKDLADKLQESEAAHGVKDDKIAELEARLAKLAEFNKEPVINPAPVKLSAPEAIAKINEYTTPDQVNELLKDETRVTVKSAGEAKLAELNK